MADLAVPAPDRKIVNRLRRVEGQVRGLERMVADGRECGEVLTQIAAIHAALDGVALGLVSRHAERCLADPGADPHERVDRLMAAVARLPRHG